MAQVVSNKVDDQPIQGLFSGFEWIVGNIPWIMVAIVVVALAIGLYYVIRKLDDERKERDDPIYQNYKNIIKSCSQNADKSRINKKYAKINLLWLGIPVVWNDFSNKLYDYHNNFMGYYRGHSYSQDGSLCFLAYKSSFLFFETLFVLK